MADIFVDTAGWGNLVDAKQAYHYGAAEIYRASEQRGGRFVTTSYILLEFITLLSSPLRITRPKSIQIIEGLRASPHISVVHIDKELDDLAWQLLKQRPDKGWSLVDCASFIVMQQHGISEALTTDHHFEQAGFMRLLKP